MGGVVGGGERRRGGRGLDGGYVEKAFWNTLWNVGRDRCIH